MKNEKGLKKATLYWQSPDWGGPVNKLEVKLVEHGTERYAQYDAAPYVVFFKKRARKARKLVVFGHDHYLLILDGWGHPDVPNPYERLESSTPGVVVERSRHLMVSGPWCQEVDAVLNPYLDHTRAVLADYRADRN